MFHYRVSNSLIVNLLSLFLKLMTKITTLVGADITERLFLDRFGQLCSDPLFHIRKVCTQLLVQYISFVSDMFLQIQIIFSLLQTLFSQFQDIEIVYSFYALWLYKV